MDKKTGYHTTSILCMPIVDHEDEVVGVAQIMNKMVGGNPAVFTHEDEQVHEIARDYARLLYRAYLCSLCGSPLSKKRF